MTIEELRKEIYKYNLTVKAGSKRLVVEEHVHNCTCTHCLYFFRGLPQVK